MTAPLAVAAALEAISRHLELVRLEYPDLPPRQQERLARSRCPDEIAAANMALDHEAAAQRRHGGAQQARR